ncbi:MAG: hypothetical protein Q9190_003502, partial [Brigantiaea leucoxantha]
LQSLSHPDRHPSAAAKPRAEATSAAINSAYRTLLDPLLRARYLLSLHGIDVSGDESISGGPGPDPSDLSNLKPGNEAQVDQEFLMEVMEVREGIEEAGSREEVEGLKVENELRIGKSEEALGKKVGAADWEGVRKETVRLGYWINVRTALEGWERVGDGRVSEHD